MANILVVEDDSIVAETLCDILANAGHKASIAHDAASALDALRLIRPDLVLTDVVMPEGDGPQIANAAETAGAKCILMSGYAEKIAELQARGVPVLAKPFRMAELLTAIDSVAGGGVLPAESGPLTTLPHR